MLKITKNQGSIQVTADKSGFYPFDGTITFPTNSLFTATSANTDMITFKSTSNGDVQFVGNYKDITISGRSYDTKQKFLTAFSNLANQSGGGTVDAYTKAETDAKLKNKLTAQTNANDALFISSSSNDDAISSVALYNSTVKGMNDVAIGWASTPDKEGEHNLAMLNEARANGRQNIAIGDQRRCDGDQNVGIGCGISYQSTVDVNGQGNVCIGRESQAHTPTPDNAAVNNSIAIGSRADASNDYCTVIGSSASSVGSHSVVIGDSADADSVGSWSVAVGSNARAHGKNSVALGYLSYATDDKPLDICCGKTADNSPLRVLQSDSTGKLSILKGDGTIERMVIQDEIEALKNAGGSGGSANPLVVVKGTNGDATIPDNITDAVAIGSGATVTKGSGIAIGGNAAAKGSDCIIIGADARSFSYDSVAIGYRAYVDSDCNSSVAVGSNAQARGERTVAIGDSSMATADSPLVINAGYITVDNVRHISTVLQSDSTGKLSVLKGDGTDERMVIQDEIEALKNAGGSGGGVDAYTKAETDTKLDAKQDKLTAGSGITITKDETTGKTFVKTKLAMGRGPFNDDGISIGRIARVELTNGIAFGDESISKHSGIAIGYKAMSSGISSIVIGKNSSDQDGAAIGTSVGSGVVIGDEARGAGAGVVIGTGTHGGGVGVVIGYNSTVDGNGYGYAIGDNIHISETTKMVPIAIGYGAVANETKPLAVTILKTGTDSEGKTELKYCDFIQGDANGKISLLKGDGTDERMVIQDEIAALKAEIAALKGGA